MIFWVDSMDSQGYLLKRKEEGKRERATIREKKSIV